MASDKWLRTILIVRKETCCRHIGYSFRLTARVLLYAPSLRQDSTYHSLCYTSRGALAGTRNSSMGPPLGHKTNVTNISLFPFSGTPTGVTNGQKTNMTIIYISISLFPSVGTQTGVTLDQNTNMTNISLFLYFRDADRGHSGPEYQYD